MKKKIAIKATEPQRVRSRTFFAFSGNPMRRRLMKETKAPAMGPKKKAILPATFGRHGALGVSAGRGGPIEYEASGVGGTIDI
jgi:hypothetical protein